MAIMQKCVLRLNQYNRFPIVGLDFDAFTILYHVLCATINNYNTIKASTSYKQCSQI